MQLHIYANGFELTGGLREHLERRLDWASGWASRYLRRLSVRLSDQNGPRGGRDKRCQIHLDLPGASVIVEDTETDLYAAIDRAADRASRSVSRWLSRHRTLRTRRPFAVHAPPSRLVPVLGGGA